MYCNKFLNRVLALALVATLLTACGGGGGGESTPVPTTPEAPTAPEAANVIEVKVDAGPSGTGYNVNRLYTTVKVCNPGTTQCQDIDHVLVDTGSFGVRLLSSAITGLNLSRLTATGGLPLLNCAQFVDLSFAWGPVVKADVVLGGMTAASVPIQVIADPDPRFSSPAAACSVGGTMIATATDLGANGILGIGLFKDDCGSGCALSPHNDRYYTCTDASCTATKGATASLAQQVKNPVPLFAADYNNGVLIDLPSANSAGAPSLIGSLIFGIGTQPNNQLASGTGTVLTADISTGYITTRLGAQSLAKSFIDSGSNGLFFESSTITKCGPSGAGFYCPTPPVNLSATLVGANGAASPDILFSIDKATDLFASRTNSALNHVLPTLAGDLPGNLSTFDWGLPFFYGRRVFFGIEGQPSTLGTGPFYAF